MTAPPPKTNKISQWKPSLTAFQSRILRGSNTAGPVPAIDWQRSSPMALLTAAGRREPQGRKKRGRVSSKPIEPLSKFSATCFFQPGKVSIFDCVNQSTIKRPNVEATTICSYVTLPRSRRMLRNTSGSTVILSSLAWSQTKTVQKPSQTTANNNADRGIAHKQNFAKEKSPSAGQNLENCCMKMPFVGVPTGVAIPPMVAL
mmetsp:Transcript_12533/g.35899  ORF Transcript_12533/g.35899 Transcript_12533/m.35899 type:complete len:202 (+) Transcript_12533:132-737(+)